MTQCYLCETESKKSGSDFGRRDVFDCKNCGIYEVGPAAIAKLTKPEFPQARKAQLMRTVMVINKEGKTAEIVFHEETLTVRAKV